MTNWRTSSVTRLPSERLLNYWGYSTVGFFAPKSAYAATGPIGMEADELKALVKLLHRNGIEIILDVVFNHTAEGDEDGPVISFRGLDNKTYYMLRPDGSYQNFQRLRQHAQLQQSRSSAGWSSIVCATGCRSTISTASGSTWPPFSAATRRATRWPTRHLLEALAHDPVLGKTKLIAEAWDAGGLYQVGSFPAYGRWSEWNGRYRDTLRRFLKGDAGQVTDDGHRDSGIAGYVRRARAYGLDQLCHLP